MRSFPDGREKQQISNSGGQRPCWRRDATELFYLTPDGDLVATVISTAPTLTVGKRETLFRAPIDPTFTNFSQQYDVSVDGQRFLMVVPAVEIRRPVNVILNWQALLRK